MAIYVVPLPVKLLNVPPVTLISPITKFVVVLLEMKVNEMDASFVVSPFETVL